MSMTLPPVELRGVAKPAIIHRPPDVDNLAAAEEACDLADALGMTLDDAQRDTLRLALGERDNGKWAAFEVADIQPRQNGKGETIQARELAGLFVFGEQLIIHTAHEFATANEAFLRMAAIIDANPELRRRVQRIRYGNGEQGVELRDGRRIKYKARTGGAGRGFAGADLVVYDEAYALQAEHIAASLPTMSTAPNPQVWFASSAGLSTSSQLWALRRRAVSGSAGRLAYSEFTAERIEVDELGRLRSLPIDPADRRLWAMANPAVGSRISWDYLEAEFAAMPVEQFARERLGVWDPIEGEHRPPKLPVSHWHRCGRMVSEPPPPPYTLAFDVDIDGRDASICVGAGNVAEPYIEHVEFRPGVGWLADRLVELVAAHDPIAVGCNGRGPAGAQVGAVLAAFRDAGVSGDLLVQMDATRYQQACGAFYAAIVEGRLVRHDGSDPLRIAGEDATDRVLGEGWVWDRRSATVPISPLVAATIAAALLPTAPVAQPPPVFAY